MLRTPNSQIAWRVKIGFWEDSFKENIRPTNGGRDLTQKQDAYRADRT